ncbi:MAG: hypothetical protein OES57_18210 [Acidimicrobiia bacterium]|nr:hypothetical protein [Acidimicrobiia bacterium]
MPRPKLPTSASDDEPGRPALRHVRYLLRSLTLNGVPVSVGTGTLVAARPVGAEAIDWEIVVSSSTPLELEQAVYDIDTCTTQDRALRGSALLVRTDGRSHVFRGAAELDGLTDSDLT